MRHMKLAQHREQLRSSTGPELERMLAEERKNLFMGRKDSATKTLENPKKIRQTRKNIARILTIISERQRESAKGNQ